MSDEGSEEDTPIEFIYVAQDEQSSGEEPSPSEWSSLEVSIPEENVKKVLFQEGKYAPGSGEICTKYLKMSDSSMFRHLYYNYPAVLDPGIEEALFVKEQPVVWAHDGQALYLNLCEEMNVCPVRLFHRNLLNSDINISYYGVNPKGVRAMATALQYNKNVSRFDLTENFLNDDACYHLGKMLGLNVTLSELILAGCRIGASGMLRLGNNLQHNRSLEFLNLENNNLGDPGGMHFAQQIFDGCTVKRVNLSKNQLGKQTALAFADVWEWNNKFTHLDLSWNNFHHQATTTKMLDHLILSEHLEELNLSHNALEGERVANAIKNLLLIPTLMVLNLSHNLLQGEAIEAIASNLFKANKIVTFDLSYNPLAPKDAFNVLQKMLRPKIKIQNLFMEGVCVEKPFLELLAKVRNMKSRKNFVCKFDEVLENWTIKGPDARQLILIRAQYLGKVAKKNKVDTALYFMALAKEYPKPIMIKDLVDRVKQDSVNLDEDLIEEFSIVFPGPKTPKSRTISLFLICDYIHRLWPDKQLPPTPPPEPEPEPLPRPPKKGKGKK